MARNRDINIGWRSFQHFAIPPGTSPQFLNLMKLAYFAGASVYADEPWLSDIEDELMNIGEKIAGKRIPGFPFVTDQDPDSPQQ